MTRSRSDALRTRARKLRAVKRRNAKELKASKALKLIFYDARGAIQRVILNKGYLILSYLTPYNNILQSYFILVRHHL
jgi:hypothetical protein